MEIKYIKDNGIYIYSLNGKDYYLEKKLEYNKKMSSKQKIKNRLEKEAFFIVEKNESKLGRVVLFLLAASIGATILKYGNDLFNEHSLKPKDNVMLEDSIDENEIAIEKWKELQSKIQKEEYTDEEMEILVTEILLDQEQFDSKEEAILFYALNCLEQNPNFTANEKINLRKEITNKILTYGKYYNAKTILKMLEEYENVSVIRKYGTNTSSLENEGQYGIITYDPSCIDCYKMLHKELTRAELFKQNIKPIYNEARAGFLSNTGNHKSRALLTILGMIGNDKEILTALINNQVDTIRMSVLKECNNDIEKKALSMFELIESWNAEEVADESDFVKDNDIVSCLEEMYETIYGLNPQNRPVMIILIDILKNGTLNYESHDHLLTGINLPVTIKIDNMEKTTNVSTRVDYSVNDLDNERLQILIDYLKWEIQSQNIPYEMSAAAWLENIMGHELFLLFINSDNPQQTLNNLNNSHSDKFQMYIDEKTIRIVIYEAKRGNLDSLNNELELENESTLKHILEN